LGFMVFSALSRKVQGGIGHFDFLVENISTAGSVNPMSVFCLDENVVKALSPPEWRHDFVDISISFS